MPTYLKSPTVCSFTLFFSPKTNNSSINSRSSFDFKGVNFNVLQRLTLTIPLLYVSIIGTLNAQEGGQPLEQKDDIQTVQAVPPYEFPHLSGYGDLCGYPADGSDRALQLSKDGSAAVVYGPLEKTDIYKIERDSCYKIATLPVKTERATFSHSGKTLFLLHSRSWSGIKLTAYDTRSGLAVRSKTLSRKSNALTINSGDSLLGISSGSLIRLLNAEDLTTVNVYWETQKQDKLIFNPTMPMEVASVNPDGTIQVRDLKEDSILAEIKTHESPVEWLGYHPNGKLLASQDRQGNLYVWSISDNKNVFQMKQAKGSLGFDRQGIFYWNSGTSWESTDLTKYGVDDKIDTIPSPYFLHREQKSFEIMPQPLITYTPETGMLYGGSSSFLFYPKNLMKYPPYYIPSSVISTVAYAPEGKQLRTSIAMNIYSENGWTLSNFISYNARARNYFFGIGNQAHKEDRQAYRMNTFYFNGSILRNVNNHLKLGVGYNVRHDTPPVFDQEEIPQNGSSGGTLVGAGPILQIDRRNDMLFPTDGSFLDTRVYFYHSAIQSDFEYKEMIFDYRRYIPIKLLKNTDVLAFQGFIHATWGGDAPFYQLPHFTAERALRGIWRNLYIDRQVYFFHAELRSFILRNDTRYGFVLFAGAGDGAENFLEDYSNHAIKVVYGTGYRQQLVPKLRLDFRIDCAFTNRGDFGISGGVGVAF